MQSLLRLKEPAVVLRCRKDDLDLVESVVIVAKKEYAEKSSANPPDIVIDKNTFLPPPLNPKNAHGSYWYIFPSILC